MDALCLHWSTVNSRKFCLVVLLLNDKILPWYRWNWDWYLFFCCWTDFHVCYEWFLEITMLKYCSLPLFGWFSSRGSLRERGPLLRCCLFVIVRKTSLDFCLILVVLTVSDSNLPPNKNCVSLANMSSFSLRSCFVFMGSPAICFRAVKRLVYKILSKAWSSNSTVWSKFVRIFDSETSTRLMQELQAFSTVVQILYKGPIASSNFYCNFSKFEFAATSRLAALFSNIRSLINSCIFLGGWRLRETWFSTKMLSCKSFSGRNLLKWSFVYVPIFSGWTHIKPSFLGTAQNLLKSAYSSSPFSETSPSLAIMYLSFLRVSFWLH